MGTFVENVNKVAADLTQVNMDNIAIEYTEGQEPQELKDAFAKVAIDEAVKHFENKTSELINQKVVDYNKANGTAFGGVHAAANYRFDTGYTHQPFCQQVWTYNVAIWEAIRNWHSTLTAIPTDEDWQAVVDTVVF